ncbi:prephenate dehydrogenase [Paenibacillus gallinarum]|uniref:Prephenate dehydrogenase n=1 Tax=Paenibacillus gallinarum TaxID=2762232 RepID=A0ABR8SY97_9BACL|nr:prephenate dehydrogenase [Paenibacillus gallinarum]MBD7968054.1 prephenate dehydrogenase [Paenibacillus gallinarum]
MRTEGINCKIAIFGVGLIGGSLALCFKGKPGIEVVGYAHEPKIHERYLKSGVLDHVTLSIEEAALDADFIFLSVPVGMLNYYLQELNKLPLKKGCIITDVGSTKASITAAAKTLDFRDVFFIGGHPMAGSERSGVEAASPLLFENAYYVLTPQPEMEEDVYNKLHNLLSYTRAQVIRVEPEHHDDIVGAISHLPHIIAVALVNQISSYNQNEPLYQLLAAGGFRDITRIASSDPVVWRDILLSNREVLLRLLRDWNKQVGQFTQVLEESNGEAIEAAFREAGSFRDQLPERRKGIINALFDIYIDVPDTPGIIGRIATELGTARINLSNMQIIESREDVPGILRLSFRQEDDMERAIELLTHLGYTVRS